MFSHSETVLCPVDGCTQPHRDRVAAIVQAPITKINIRMGSIHLGLDAALSEAVGEASAERSRALEGVLREHAESHDVLDYLRTIRRLQCDLEGQRSGIRGHMTRPGGPDPHPLRMALGAAPSADVVEQLRDHVGRDWGLR